MNKKVKIVVIAIVILCIGTIIGFKYVKTNQVEISAKNKNIIRVGGFQYKDLNGNGKLDDYENWKLSSEQRAKDLISQMTLEEKAGMMLIHSQVSSVRQENKELTSMNGLLNEEENSFSEGEMTLIYSGNTKTIKDLNIRHIILREPISIEQLIAWENALNELAESTRLGIPILVTCNARNNASRIYESAKTNNYTEYPTTLGIAAATMGEEKQKGKSDIIENFGETVRKEFMATGIRKGYMYSADLMTDARWVRNNETFGENVEFVSKTMETLVKTIQGGEHLSKTGVALTIKHFPGSGARVNGKDAHLETGKYSLYETENSLANYHLPAFQSAINVGVSSIIPYYSLPDSNSASQVYQNQEIHMTGSSYSFNDEFITKLLRQNMGFQGYINTDSSVIEAYSWGEEEKTEVERVAKAINAGVDLISDTNHVEWIIEAVEQGLVTEERINESLKRILTEMFDLGLFENPYLDEEKSITQIKTEETLKNAYEVHQKSIVLLKNREETLPIKVQEGNDKIKVYIQEFGTTGRLILDALNMGNYPIEVVEDYNQADYFITYIAGKVTEEKTYELDLKNSVIGENYDEWVAIGNAVKENGGKRITMINFQTAYIVDGIEQNTDCLMGGFNTYTSAIMKAMLGESEITGVLPFTLPANNQVVAINEEGKCASPNDVPGYDKSKYIENGLKYEYVDEVGNTYLCGFGL